MATRDPRQPGDDAPVLIAAAMWRELEGVARLKLPRAEIFESGVGRTSTERRLRQRLSRGAVRAVINIGLAGALSAELGVGDIVIVRQVRMPGAPALDLMPMMPTLATAARPSYGIAVTIDEIAVTSAAKRALGATIPAGEIGIVDMESAAVASLCAEFHVPLLIARAVSDLFDEDLPVDFNRCRDSEGQVNSSKVLSQALIRPKALVGLIELRRRSRFCAEKLAVFTRDLLVTTAEGRV